MNLENLAEILEQAGLDRVSVAGSQVRACCPFHGERTPSFYAHPERGFYCFGCGAKGPSPKVLFEKLGTDLGIDFDRVERDHLFDFLERESAPDPLDPRIVSLYRDDPDHFRERWGASKEVTKRRMLKIDPDTGGELFPLFGLDEAFYGFVERREGRLRSIYRYPKGFKKSDHLLGAVKTMRDVWVVEGVRDLVRVESVLGVDAVALGTAIPSERQLDLLARYDSITLCLDNDDAGRSGRDRIAKTLPLGLLHLARYSGKDPMEGQDFESIPLKHLVLN